MTQNPRKQIGVIGNGIAGLAAAIAAGRAGHDVTIFGPEIKGASGALQLAPNGFAALERLGVMEAVRPHLLKLDAIEIRNSRSHATLAVIDHRTPHPRDYASLGRSALITSLTQLAKSLTSITFQNDRVLSIANEDDKSLLVTEAGSYSFDAIIGADGASGIARAFVSHDKQMPSARLALRAAVPAQNLPAHFASLRTQLWLGQGFHLVSYPFDGGKEVNLVLCCEASHADGKAIATELLSQNTVLSEILATDIHWHKTPLPAANQLANWRRGNVVVIGDAAHYMPPHLAQGAGQTLEDAACLYEALKGDKPLTQTLQSFALMRARALAPLIQKAETTGAVMRLKGPLAKLRNMALEVGGQRLVEGWLRQVWHADPLSKDS